MTHQIDRLTTRLNSAYSLEQSLVHILENHAKEAEDFPGCSSNGNPPARTI